MKASTVRLVLILVLGAAAPYIYVASVGLFSLYIAPLVMQWMWVTFSIKGVGVVWLIDAGHSLLLAPIIALALRLVANREWRLEAGAFCVTFLVAFYSPGLFEGSGFTEILSLVRLSAVGISVLLVSVVALLAAFARLPRPEKVRDRLLVADTRQQAASRRLLRAGQR